MEVSIDGGKTFKTCEDEVIVKYSRVLAVGFDQNAKVFFTFTKKYVATDVWVGYENVGAIRETPDDIATRLIEEK